MSLTYNGVTPTSISYNGTNLTVVKYNNAAVWGKKYTLSISCDANTTLTVTRTSSPNQHASTGTLSNGSAIYYGDLLYVTAVANSGYSLNSLTWDGTTMTSGSYITITSNLAIAASSILSATWHTVYSGNFYASCLDDMAPTIPNLLRTDTPTTVTFSACMNTLFNSYYETFTDVTLPTSGRVTHNDECGYFDYYIDGGGNSSTFGVILEPNLAGPIGEAYILVKEIKQYY